MSALPQSPDWPANSLPERWIEALFSTMAACYGARFADLWRGSKIEDVKRLWGIELFKLTREQLKAGRENLTTLAKPPTLPEFIAHCRQSRTDATASAAPKLEFAPRMTPEQAAANLAKVHAGIRLKRADEASAEWAFKLVMHGKSPKGHSLTHEAMRCARDAITSAAGARVVEECSDPALREQYAKLRQTTIDDYRMRGIRLWNVA